ncbi:MAG TPA: GIY-YIG nuclease family protein, partial [Chitinophagaceae bacterium]|nr:GIY-YIG nuclease family protein [Chitinophagaceae bacterium]
MYYIYILYSETSDLYYVGYTNDYQRRVEQHNESPNNTYTSKHHPWIIKALFECGDNEAKAMRLEKFIKKQKSKVFLEKLINSQTSELTG